MAVAHSRAFRRAAHALLGVLILTSVAFVGQSGAHAERRAAASLPTIQWPGMVGLSSWFASLDPAQAGDAVSYSAILLVNDTLVHRLPGTRYTSGLASMKLSKNKRVYTFTLRKGLRFSNGDPLTATDVVYSLKRMLAPSSASTIGIAELNTIEGATDFHSGKSPSLSGVVKINSRTVQVRTTRANAALPLTLALPAGVILDHKVLQGKNATAANNYLTNTCSGNVGAGPFDFVCRNTRSDLSSFYPSGATPRATFVPNKYYYGKPAHVKLAMQAIKDANTALLEYQSGQLDVSPIPTTDIGSYQGKKGFYRFGSTSVSYLSPDVGLAPFNNVHCRLALAYGINTEQINKTVLHGSQATIHDMVPKGLVGYYSGKGEPQYNPTKAKSELAQCPGGIQGQKLVYPELGSDFDLVYAGAIPAQLAALGMDVKGEGIPVTSWLKIVEGSQKAANIPLVLSELSANGADIICLTRSTGFILDSGDWSNKKYDALCKQGEVTFSVKKQEQIYQQAQHIALQAGVWITMGQGLNFFLVRSTIHGLVGDPYFDVMAPKGWDWSNLTVGK